MQEPALEQIFGNYTAWKVEVLDAKPALCRVRWKNASIFISKDLVMTVYGKR